MKPSPRKPTELRRRAEARLRRRKPTGSKPKSDAKLARLVHELEVHQIELEMQNEELRHAHAIVDELLARYTDLYDFAPTGYMTLDCKGAIRQVNLEAARLLGIERSLLEKRRFGQFVGEGDRRTFGDFLQRVFAHHGKEHCEVTLPQARRHALSVRIEGVLSEDGQDCRATFADITERKLAEDRMAWLSTFPEMDPDPVLEVEEPNRVTFSNRATNQHLKRMGVPNDPSAFLPADLPAIFNMTRANARPISVTREITIGGATFVEHIYRAQSPSALRIYAQDVTATRLFDEASVGMMLTALDGRMLKVNRALSSMLGYAEGELAEVNFAEIAHPEDEAASREDVRRLAAGEAASRRFQKRCLHKDGHAVWVDVSTALLRDSKGKPLHMVTHVQDITERKLAEIERERLNEILARRADELEQLVHVASHDLRSPLVSVSGFVGELRINLAELQEMLRQPGVPIEIREKLIPILDRDIAESMQYIEAGTSRMNSLLAALLKFSRLGRVALHIEPIDADRIVRESLAALEFAVREAGAQVAVASLPSCRADAVQFGQVITNILDNAVKYRDPARPLRVQISGTAKKGRRVVYCIEDNGIGIPDEHREKIFAIFHRVNTDAGKGEGLGLAIASWIMARLDGRIRVESELGEGSRFYVELPAAEDEAEPPDQPERPVSKRK